MRRFEEGEPRVEEPAAGEEAGEDLRRRALQRRVVQRKASRGVQGRPEIPQAGGAPLAAAHRGRMEAEIGAELGDVQVHTGSDSAACAEQLGARAFTVGREVHFAAGEFAPGTKEGDRLLAHELTHAAQAGPGLQRKAEEAEVSEPDDPAEREADAVGDRVAESLHAGGGRGAPAGIQRKSDGATLFRASNGFNAAYGGKLVTNNGQSYDDYKKGLGPLEASSEGLDKKGQKSGHAVASPLTLHELLQIFPELSKNAEKKPEVMQLAAEYLQELNEAWRLMKLDTVEAQAAFLANAAIESKQFRKMSEAQVDSSSYEDDPAKIKLNTKDLDDARDTGKMNKVPVGDNYRRGGAIEANSNGDWKKSLIGRGPLQVTGRQNYLEAIAILEHQAEELKGVPGSEQDAETLKNAADAIKADPQAAMKPQYTMLLSAAYMKRKTAPTDKQGKPTGPAEAGDIKANRGDVTSWMGSGQPLKTDKATAHQRALTVLKVKLEEEKKQRLEHEKAHTP